MQGGQEIQDLPEGAVVENQATLYHSIKNSINSGRSSSPSNVYTHELSASDIFGLLDKLEIDRFKAIGHSSGAMTLTHMATMDSSRLTAMILVGSTSYFPGECRSIQKNYSYETISDGLKSFLESHHPGGEE